MTASKDTARRGISDPLALTGEILWIWFKLIDCAFSVKENLNTLNRGLTHQLDASSSDLPYLEHPYNPLRDSLELNTVIASAHTSKNGFRNLSKRPCVID